MTPEEITEGNRIIAEFMGLKYDDHDEQWHDGKYFKTDLLLYNSNWELIMPVVEKIADFTVRESGKIKIFSSMNFSISVGQFSSCRHHVIVTGSITKVGGTEESHEYNKISVPQISIANDGVSAMNSIWLAVVEFIKWHNQQK